MTTSPRISLRLTRLIAATDLVHGLELATLDIKHFPMFAELEPACSLHASG